MSDQANPPTGELVRCQQCGNPAIWYVGPTKIPLCLICCERFERINNAQIETMERHLNNLRDEMDMISGIPSFDRYPPRRKPTVHIGAMQNINIDNSVIGVLNAGTIAHLNGTVNAIRQADDGLASCIVRLAEALAADPALTPTQKRNAVDVLDAVADEVRKPADQRRRAVVESMLPTLANLATIGTAAYSAWQSLEPMLKSAFGF